MTETMNSNHGQPEADPTPETQEQSAGSTQGPTDMNKDIEDNKLMAVIAYLSILFLIPLLAKKDSPYAQFHAKQGMVVFVAGLLSWVIGIVPIIGWILAPLISLAALVLSIIGIVNALQGKMKELPLIGQYAKSIKI